MIQFPLFYKETKSHGREVIKPLPFTEDWNKLTKSQDIRENNGVGVLTGRVNGITVIDFDKEEIRQSVLKKYPEFERTTIQKTPNGYHYIFKYSELVPHRQFSETKYDGMDIVNDNGCIILEPSYQIDVATGIKRHYKVIQKKPLKDLPLGFIEDIAEVTSETAVSTMQKTDKPQSHRSGDDKSKGGREQQQVPQNDGSLPQYSVCDIKYVGNALAGIDPVGKDWFLATSALKALHNSGNLGHKIKELWVAWSKGKPKYFDEENNEKIWKSIGKTIHPNYLFKKADLKFRCRDIVYRDDAIKFDYIDEAQYLGYLFDFRSSKELPDNAIEHFLLDKDTMRDRKDRMLRFLSSDVCIKSDTGTGKTTLAVDYVANHCSSGSGGDSTATTSATDDEDDDHVVPGDDTS